MSLREYRRKREFDKTVEPSGKKLSGEWYLVRLRDDRQWLLIRGKDNLPPVSKKMDDFPRFPAQP